MIDTCKSYPTNKQGLYVFKVKVDTMKNFVIILSLFAMVSCSKEDETTQLDQFIFGHFFGECFGESCVEIFKIENGLLYEDTLDQYPNINGNDFEWVLVEDININELEVSMSLVPSELYDEEAIVLGMPDAGDWGGIYVQTNRGGDIRFWLIDHMDENIPEYLHEFTASIKSSIAMMQ